jgi:hypothetical protein
MRSVSLAVSEVLASSVRQPRWRMEAWQLFGEGAPTIGAIIAGTATSTTHPTFYLDLTDFARDGVTLEEPGDRRAGRLTCTLVDHLMRFHPDDGAYAAWMRPGTLLRVAQGDATLEATDWVYVFTGHLRGQVGFTRDRRSLQYETSLTAYGRRATPLYLKQKFTSATYGKRVEYGTICQEIALDQMHLAAAEMDRFPSALGKVTQFSSNSIVDLTPLEALDKILETVGLVADFDGQGILRAYSRDVRRAPDLRYEKWDLILAERFEATEIEVYNSVSVTGLDKNITEVEQPEQALARAVVPIGFWRPSHRVHLQWSENNSLRARHTQLKILTSVNESLMWDMGAEHYDAESEFGGVLRVELDDFLLSLLAVISLAGTTAAAFPDLVEAVGVGVTTPIGRIAQGVFQLLAYQTLATQSSGQYEVWGTPVIPVYKEITAVVTATGIPAWAEHVKELSNDWLNTVEELTEIAKLELLWETAQSAPRTLTVLDDWRVEIGDLLLLPSGKKLFVESWRKTLGREDVGALELSCYLVPEGV